MKPKDFQEWTFLGSVYYALSLTTTIGYGNISPGTTVGRVLTIFYALIGIPLAIITLNQLGKILLTLEWNAYMFVRLRLMRCGLCRPKTMEDVAEFPLVLGLLLTLCWMLLCSCLFCVWEDWDYFISFYFFFISLTTIGLGDVTPKYPSYMIGSFVLILVGLAMVSMCFNLIQMKLQSLVKKTMIQIQTTLHIPQDELDTDNGEGDEVSGKLECLESFIKDDSVADKTINQNIDDMFYSDTDGWLHSLLGKESKV